LYVNFESLLIRDLPLYKTDNNYGERTARDPYSRHFI